MRKTIQLNQEIINSLFETAQDSSDIVLALYKMVYGNRWDKIRAINGFPSCNKSTGLDLMQRFIDLDKKLRVETMPGGLWFNNGFSTCDSKAASLANYEILPCEDLTF